MEAHTRYAMFCCGLTKPTLKKFPLLFADIAVRLSGNKKVQNLNKMWYEDVVQTNTTQGDFELESP
jgi:hypothetical protein